MTKGAKMMRRNRWFVFIFVLLAVYVGYVTLQTEIKYRELKAQEILLNEKLKSLSEEKLELDRKLEESQSLDTIERIARDKLKMVKPDEILYMIQEKDKK